MRVQLNGDRARLTISDHGSGIPEDLRSDIFKPYKSGRSGGHGLGLAIVQRIVEDHGWEITVDSTADFGTTFTISRIIVSKKG